MSASASSRPNPTGADGAPTVSIGLPVFNGENFISEALDSILAQTYTDFELIICDNASTDGTQAICEDYASRDPRIRYHRQPRNLGACRNYDMAFEMSRGRYFKWAAHDDNLAPEFLEKLVAALDADPGCVLAHPNSIAIDADGKPFRKHIIRLASGRKKPATRLRSLLFPIGRIDPVFGLMRRDAMARTPLHGDFVGSDRVFLAAMILEGRWCALPDCLFFRRIHDMNSITSHERHDDRLFWFRGRRSLWPVFYNWRQMWGYIHAVRGATLNRRARREVYKVLGDFAWRRRMHFGRELMLPYFYNGKRTPLGNALAAAAAAGTAGAARVGKLSKRALKRLKRKLFGRPRPDRRSHE